MYGRGFGFLFFAMLVVALIAECVVYKGGLSGIGRIVVLLILISSAVFATAQFRYASVDENRDSYMQYMTDEKSVIVWGKIKALLPLSHQSPQEVKLTAYHEVFQVCGNTMHVYRRLS